uniref:Uncharacterized protein n=1 Tax=Macaca nemestrina TaxID=9545 RepID=A0A2K6APJ3_MACNE
MKANFVKISVTHSAFPNYLNWQCILESWNVSGKIHRRPSDIGSFRDDDFSLCTASDHRKFGNVYGWCACIISLKLASYLSIYLPTHLPSYPAN